MSDAVFTLHEAAAELGVHYMTVYRYVRLGVLDAVKVGGTWQVTQHALDQFRLRPERAHDAGGLGAVNGSVAVGADGAAVTSGNSGTSGRMRRAPWAERLESRLVAGDYNGAWGVIEAALTAGAELDEIYLQVLTPAMVSIGERWAVGEFDISVEHRASGIAMRIIGRLGPRFIRRGRSRGGVIVGAPAGEFHALPVAILSDLLRLRGWDVSDFGADVPSSSLIHAMSSISDVVGVGLSVTSHDNLDSVAHACATVRAADPDMLVVVGGRAVADADHARDLGAHAIARSGDEMHRLLSDHVANRR
jgi:MerR family transcriptional regulator, light-induced transcriptional regulator